MNAGSRAYGPARGANPKATGRRFDDERRVGLCPKGWRGSKDPAAFFPHPVKESVYAARLRLARGLTRATADVASGCRDFVHEDLLPRNDDRARRERP